MNTSTTDANLGAPVEWVSFFYCILSSNNAHTHNMKAVDLVLSPLHTHLPEPVCERELPDAWDLGGLCRLAAGDLHGRVEEADATGLALPSSRVPSFG